MPRRVEENLQQPKLQPVMVPADKLLLWPNNPRLFVGEDLNVPEEKFAEPGVQQRAFSQMAPSGDPFRLEELKGSFRRNGFVPVDYIFVRRHLSSGAYLVLEGNRRVSAIRQLLDEERLPAKDRKRPPLSEAVRKSLEVVECMEVVNQLPDDELTDMITYLLGVRHHGALKQWSAFAKAAHMYELYLEGIGGDSTAFRWDGVVAESVAKGLCVELKEVREGVATYRVMEDIARRESVKACDGIQDRDYSLISDSLVRGNKAVREYLPICLETFTLPDETFDRLDELCLFSKKREGAPIQRPQDWSALGKILTDIDPAKREEMLDDVRKNKVPPRVVSGNRNRELQQLDWAHWLQQLLVVIKGVNLGGIEGNEEERTVVKELGELFERLPREEG